MKSEQDWSDAVYHINTICESEKWISLEMYSFVNKNTLKMT